MTDLIHLKVWNKLWWPVLSLFVVYSCIMMLIALFTYMLWWAIFYLMLTKAVVTKKVFRYKSILLFQRWVLILAAVCWALSMSIEGTWGSGSPSNFENTSEKAGWLMVKIRWRVEVLALFVVGCSSPSLFAAFAWVVSDRELLQTVLSSRWRRWD